VFIGSGSCPYGRGISVTRVQIMLACCRLLLSVDCSCTATDPCSAMSIFNIAASNFGRAPIISFIFANALPDDGFCFSSAATDQLPSPKLFLAEMVLFVPEVEEAIVLKVIVENEPMPFFLLVSLAGFPRVTALRFCVTTFFSLMVAENIRSDPRLNVSSLTYSSTVGRTMSASMFPL